MIFDCFWQLWLVPPFVYSSLTQDFGISFSHFIFLKQLYSQQFYSKSGLEIGSLSEDKSFKVLHTSHMMLLIDITRSYLNSGLTQSCSLGQFLPHEGIRVVSSLEYLKQSSNEYSAFLFKQSNIFPR